MPEPLTIFQCPRCGRVSDGEAAAGQCAGAVYDDSFHYVTAMVRARVFREEDVRPLWAAAEQVRDRATQPTPGWAKLYRALDAFPAPEDWTA